MSLRALLCAILLALPTSQASAQLPGSVLEGGTLELGYSLGFFQRDLELVAPEGYVSDGHQPDWGTSTLFARYGVAGWLTFSAEGMIGTGYFNDRFPDRDYRSYALGLGLALRLFGTRHLDISFAARYLERLDYDRSPAAYHKNLRNVSAALRLERTLDLGASRATLWLGPAYAYDRLTENPQPGLHFTYESTNNLSIVLGGDALLFSHLRPALELVYADYIQPRLALAFRF